MIITFWPAESMKIEGLYCTVNVLCDYVSAACEYACTVLCSLCHTTNVSSLSIGVMQRIYTQTNCYS